MQDLMVAMLETYNSRKACMTLLVLVVRLCMCEEKTLKRNSKGFAMVFCRSIDKALHIVESSVMLSLRGRKT
jgi:hypothetical protein